MLLPFVEVNAGSPSNLARSTGRAFLIGWPQMQVWQRFCELRTHLIGVIITSVALWSVLPAVAEERSGEQLFKELCASCHGARGEGIKDKYAQPLIGERSLGELSEYIDKSMPEGEPEKCNAAESARIAKFMYDNFYSPAAQVRNKPARVELSRLTVRQYRQTVADLIGSFRGGMPRSDQRGLKAEYFKTRGHRDRVFERIDPSVSFDFGTNGPEPEKFDAHQFSIRWEGSVVAPDTGVYDFVVRTEHATRLWVNNLNTPLIDAIVKSGNDTEYRGSMFLLGGRAYSLKLEFSKAKQGVDDSKKEKEKPPKPASIALLWKRPQLVDEVIPARHMIPQRAPESLIIETPFPPDDRSIGYERGTTISKAWDQATTDSAIVVATYVSSKLNEFTGTKPDSGDRNQKVRDFCRRFVERAFRRPLGEEERQLYVDRQFDKTPDLETTVKRVILLALKSPRFLYREPGGANDGFSVASRISYALWDGPPDQALLDAAGKGELSSREQISKHAERMLADPRAKTKLRDFFLQWLKVNPVPDVSKDPEKYPEFNAAIATDLRTSLELFLDDVLSSDSSDFRQFFLADSLYLNGRLAKFYGAELPAEADFQKVNLDGDARAGVLSHPYLMAGFAYTSTSSPIHRGVFLSRSVLGRSLRVPPEAVAPLSPDLHASLTTRERVTLQTKPDACQTCHTMINPLGFTLENFDAVGRFRKEEQGKPIDATGGYRTPNGDTVKFTGAKELGKFLANSPEAHNAIVEQLFQNLVKQPILAYGPETLGNLRQEFVKHDFNLRRLAADIITTAALTEQTTKTASR